MPPYTAMKVIIVQMVQWQVISFLVSLERMETKQVWLWQRSAWHVHKEGHVAGELV